MRLLVAIGDTHGLHCHIEILAGHKCSPEVLTFNFLEPSLMLTKCCNQLLHLIGVEVVTFR